MCLKLYLSIENQSRFQFGVKICVFLVQTLEKAPVEETAEKEQVDTKGEEEKQDEDEEEEEAEEEYDEEELEEVSTSFYFYIFSFVDRRETKLMCNIAV